MGFAPMMRRHAVGVTVSSRFTLVLQRRCSSSSARMIAYFSFIVRGTFIGVETQAYASQTHPSLHTVDMVTRSFLGMVFF